MTEIKASSKVFYSYFWESTYSGFKFFVTYFTNFYDSFFFIANVVLGYKFEGLTNSEFNPKLSPILPLTVLTPLRTPFFSILFLFGDEIFLSSEILAFYLLLPVRFIKSLNTGRLLIEVGARWVRPGETGSIN